MKIELKNSFLNQNELEQYRESFQDAYQSLISEETQGAGWRELPDNCGKGETLHILEIAEKIKNLCDTLIVIGIGGSYLGAKACIEMLSPSFFFPSGVSVYFAGQNLSASYHAELLRAIGNQDICVCVISKSGNTAEPNLVFSIIREWMKEKYGESFRNRIFTVTGIEKNILLEEAQREKYQQLFIPEDVGGRYSVLTPAGLLPIAACGIDIQEVLQGALDGKREYDHNCYENNPCGWYAAAREILFQKGKLIEIYEYYEPKLSGMGEWLKQLFGESQGKNGTGIFPTSLQFTADLHSMGQFIQEGNPIFFETVLHVKEPDEDIVIPETAEPVFRGKTMNQVNLATKEGVICAHTEENIPVIEIDIPALTPYYFGKMVYFFEMSCALGGFLMGVNPFNQPGVEQYKQQMRNILNGKK